MLTVVGCGDTADPLDVPELPDVTVETPLPTTTTTAGDRVEIRTDGVLKWDTGVYAASTFWVPVSFAPVDPGWWSLGAADLWLSLQFHETGESAFDLDLTLLAHAPGDPPESALAGILGREEVSTSTTPTATSVAGHDAVMVDLVVAASPLFGGTCEVNPAPGNTIFPTNDSGIYLLTEVGGTAQGPYGNGFGIRSCRAARLWAIDVDGDTILVIAATTSPAQFDRLIAYADRLLSTMAFDHSG